MDLFENEVVRTLGLHQPFATALYLDHKIETRWVTWGKKPPFPIGRYMIYSTQKIYSPNEVLAIGKDWALCGWQNDIRYLIRGTPLYVADLCSVRDMTEEDQPNTFVKYYPPQTKRLVVLRFARYRRIKFHGKFKGKQGVGILTPEQKAQIEFL